MGKAMKRVVPSILLAMILLIGVAAPVVQAKVTRTVKVAFFPMSGFNETLPNGEKSGMDVDYLHKICSYVDWKIEYVECASWDEALEKLKNEEVDLVGSAQYSEERAKVYSYAQLSSGYTYGVVATREDNKVAFEDFSSIRDMKIGMVSTYVRSAEFYEYLRQAGIDKPNVVSYDDAEAMRKALDDGEIDAFVHTLTEVGENHRVIGKFAPKPFYYISYKGNDELMSELDLALADIKFNEPDFEATLIEKYYSDKQLSEVVFTTEEKYFIEKTQTLKVGYMDGYYPFSYMENGEFSGLSRRLLEKMSEMTGLKMEYHMIIDSKDAVDAIKTGRIDLLCYSPLTEEQLEANNILALKVYSDVPLVLVTKRGNTSNKLGTVAIVPELYKEAESAVGTDGREFVEYTTQQEALTAVANGDCDAALCDGYLCELVLAKDAAFSSLIIERVLNTDHSISMVMDGEKSTLFAGLVNKTTSVVTDKQVGEYIIETNVFTMVTLDEFIRNHSISIIILLLVLIATATGVGIHLYRDSGRIQKLMYKDINMDVWNINYLNYNAKNILNSNNRELYAVAVMKLAQYKLYNSLYGKTMSQHLLYGVVNVISDNMEGKDIYARDHGDRFVIFIKEVGEQELKLRLQKIKKDIENRILEDTGSHMNLIMGASVIAKGDKDFESALANANLALDAAEQGTDEIVIYDQQFSDELKANHKREQMLKSINIEENFLIYYQAKVDIRTEEIVGAEALIRFSDPTDGGAIKSPFFFIPYYEKTGRIKEIDFFVLEGVCKFLRKRIDTGQKVVPISVNFSRHHFMRPGFSDRFMAVLKKYEVPENLVEVEITETIVIEELQRRFVKRNIDELTTEGIHLSIDDFGSGYSSLGVFEQIPASVIKLDRSFLLNKEDKERQVAIMKAVVHMAKDLNAQIVCEGVENDEDVALMHSIDAHIAQGFKYSMPIPEKEFESKLDSGIFSD